MVFQRAKAIIVARIGHVIVRLHKQVVAQRGLGAAFVDHLVFDIAAAQRIRAEHPFSGALVEGHGAVRRRIFVRPTEQADEGHRVAFDVVAVGEEIGLADAQVAAQPSLVYGAQRTRSVVDRRDVDFNDRRVARAVGIGQYILEAGRTIEVGTDLELEIVAPDRAADIRPGEHVIDMLIAIDAFSLKVLQGPDAGDMQALDIRRPVDVEIIG